MAALLECPGRIADCSFHHFKYGRSIIPACRQTLRKSFCISFVILLMASLAQVTNAGTSAVNITRVMASSLNGRGLVELNIIPGRNVAVTNSNQNFSFWYEEIGSGNVAQTNNNVTRFFICSLDQVGLFRYRSCGDVPVLQDPTNPSGQYGAVKRFAVFSRLREGHHVFRIRATSVGFGATDTIDCGLLNEGDTYERCGPATSFPFIIDVTPPTVEITNYWTPPMNQARFGTLWEGYFDPTSSSPDYVERASEYEVTNGLPFLRGTAGLTYVNSSTFMAEYRASEANIDHFECKLDSFSYSSCDNRFGLDDGISLSGTGYTRQGQVGLVYYEGILSNGSLYGVDGSNAGPRTSFHSITVRAVDQAGNVGQGITIGWIIDQDIPLVRIDKSKLLDGGTRKSVSPRAAFHFLSSNAGILFECRVQCVATSSVAPSCEFSAYFEPCSSPFQTSLSLDLLQGSKRRYTFTVRATDQAGNVGGCASPVDTLASNVFTECAAYTWDVDVRVPAVELYVDHDGSSRTNIEMATTIPLSAMETFCNQSVEGQCLVASKSIGFLFSYENVEEITFDCQLDRPVWFDCGVGGNTQLGSPYFMLMHRTSSILALGVEYLQNLKDGPHFFKVRAVNSHGTTGIPQEWQWYSDAVTPIAVFTRTPPPLTTVDSARFEFAVYPAESDLRFECSWNSGEDFFPCDSQNLTVPGNNTELDRNITTPQSGEWTEWMNFGSPTEISVDGGGDFEYTACPDGSLTPGELPTAIECRIANSLLPFADGDQVLESPCAIESGLVCKNSDQPDGRLCFDYEIRIRCGSPSNEFTLGLVNVANSFILYVDGDFVATSRDWTVTQQVRIPADFESIAIVAESFSGEHNSTDGSVGILFSIPTYGLASDSNWKCLGTQEGTSIPHDWSQTNFDDFLWDDAVARGFVGDEPWGSLYVNHYSNRTSTRHHLPYSQWIWARQTEDILPTRAYCRYRRLVNTHRFHGRPSYKIHEGDNRFTVRVTDRAGNVQTDPTTFQWEVDYTPPVAKFSLTPSGIWDEESTTGEIARVASTNAEFGFVAEGELQIENTQFYRGHQVKSRYRFILDGTTLSGYYCSPGTYLCGETCRSIPVCDRNISDRVALDPLDGVVCATALEGCDSTGRRTSPISFLNMEASFHKLEMWAIDAIGNIGNSVVYTWMIDTTAPVVSVERRPRDVNDSDKFDRTIVMVFRTIPRLGHFECVKEYQCAVGDGLSLSPSVVTWSPCAIHLDTVCQGILNYHVQVSLVSSIPNVVNILEFVQSITNSTSNQFLDVTISSVLLSTQYPFQIIFTGRSGLLTGTRFAYEAVDASYYLIGSDIALEECQSECSLNLGCKAIYFTVTRGLCFGFTAVPTESRSETRESFSLIRREAVPPLPAIDIDFSLSLQQHRHSKRDVVRELQLELDRAISGIQHFALGYRLNLYGFRANGAVHTMIRSIGFGQDNHLHDSDLISALSSTLGFTDFHPMPHVNVTSSLLNDFTAISDYEVLILCSLDQASVLHSRLQNVMENGSLWDSLYVLNLSRYDRRAINFTHSISSSDSVGWLNETGIRSAIIASLRRVGHVGERFSERDIHHIELVPDLPHTGYAMVISTVFGTPESQINGTVSLALMTIFDSVGFRVELLNYLSEQLQNGDVHISQIEAPLAYRITVLSGFSVQPTILEPALKLIDDPEAVSTHKFHDVQYGSGGADDCTSGNLTCLDDGKYNFLIRAMDISGNVGPVSSQSFEIDSIPPTILWKARPPKISNVQNGERAVFDFQCNEVNSLGISLCSFKCALIQSWTIPDSVSLLACPPAPVIYQTRGGKYTFLISATDQSGNRGNIAFHQFEVDDEMPVAEIVNGRPPTFTRDQNIRFELNASEPGTFWCSLEIGNCIINNSCFSGQGASIGRVNVPYHRCSESVLVPSMPTFTAQFPRGSSGDPPVLFRFRVLLEDIAGNLQSFPDVAVWTFDTHAPSVRVLEYMRPFLLSAQSNPSIGFEVTDGLNDRLTFFNLNSIDGLLPIDMVYALPLSECLLLMDDEILEYDRATNSARSAWEGWIPCQSPFRINVTVGTALFVVRCSDVAGNDGNFAEVRWTVDGDPPELEQREVLHSLSDVLVHQELEPQPPVYDQGFAVADVELIAPLDNITIGTVHLRKFMNGTVTYHINVSSRVGGVSKLSFSIPESETLEKLVLFTLSAPDPHGSWTIDSSLYMHLFLEDYVHAELIFSGGIICTSIAHFRFQAYFELYSQFPRNTESTLGFRSRMQCCLDRNCNSNCITCHDVDIADDPICAIDCSSRDSIMVSRCPCDDTAIYNEWPPGYHESQLSVMDVDYSVPDNIWHLDWDCSEGGKVLANLREGMHVFAARTIDQALRVSRTPLVYEWYIDSQAPLVGIIKVPPVISNVSSTNCEFLSSEKHVLVKCDPIQANTCLLIRQNQGSFLFAVSNTQSDTSNLSVSASDMARNVDASESFEWTTDLIGPETNIDRVSAGDGHLHGWVRSENGSNVHCNLTGTLLDGGSVFVDGCRKAHSSNVILVVSGAKALKIVNGMYYRRLCGSTTCYKNNRHVYDHSVHDIELFYDLGAWLIVSQGTVLISLTTTTISITAVKDNVWMASNGIPLPEIQLHDSMCTGLCPQMFSYDALPSGYYSLCTWAIDLAGNIGNAECNNDIDISTSLDRWTVNEQTAKNDSKPCDVAEQERAIAAAASVGFITFTVGLSALIFLRRKANAITLAAQHKADAIISSTSGFQNASLDPDAAMSY